MDDMLIFNMEKEELLKLNREIKDFLLSELGLSLKVDQINRNKLGIPFLGYRVFFHSLRLSPVSKKQFISKWYQLNELLHQDFISEQAYCRRTNALFSFA